MEDKVEKSLANYDLTVKRRYRHRGGWLLETTQGPKLLREYEQIRGHFAFENKIKEILVLRGFERVDKALKNNADEYVTELESGEKYVIYQWFSGEEPAGKAGSGSCGREPCETASNAGGRVRAGGRRRITACRCAPFGAGTEAHAGIETNPYIYEKEKTADRI